VSRRIRFHLDEHIDRDIARALLLYGIDVTTTVEAGLRTKTDEDQWLFIQQQQRVLVTQDRDFLVMASMSNDYPGMVYFKQGSRSIGQVIEMLILLYEIYTPEDMLGMVEYL
jgi:predicted nuclease of predicted toxin-antitoxin system